MKFSDRFEFTTPQDPSLNYCLWKYDAPGVSEDKFRSINLLLQSFDYSAMDTRAFDIIEAIRDAIGDFKTVFGVKLVEGRLAWEFYFYDYQREQREVAISDVLTALAPLASCRIKPNENLPYFMFSLDLDAELARGERAIDIVHMYIGNPGSTVSSGIAYALREHSSTLENFYFFFDAATQLTQAAEKIRCSAYFDTTQLSIDEVLIPELRRCHTICVANKQTHDCVYFSGVDVDQLLFFLRLLEYPADVIEFVEVNRHNLDHLLYDVGVDYRIEEGRVEFLKSGYYGVF